MNNINTDNRREKNHIKELFDSLATNRRYLRKNRNYYHRQLIRLYRFLIPEGSKVLELGCGIGGLLASVKPSHGVGVDISSEMIKLAKDRHPTMRFHEDDVENLQIQDESFGYIILADIVGFSNNINSIIKRLKNLCSDDTRLIFSFYNPLWEPVIRLARILQLKLNPVISNWISPNDIENLLEVNGFKMIRKGKYMLFPMNIPILSNLLNKFVAALPVINNICLVNYIVARKMPEVEKDHSSSIIVPCLDEKENIEPLIIRTPEFGTGIEIIFIDGGSTDGTVEEIERIIKKYPDKTISLIHQGGAYGKNDAIRKGFKEAKGDILFVHDSDITVAPEILPEFYDVISSGRGEFINGSRLVYGLDTGAMRFLNLLGNKFFSMVFTYLLNQKVKDTLCGTKVILRRNWKKIDENRKYFGEFDPFGDFELLFGASKLNLDIVELPVKYRARKYGDIKISRFRHGLILLKMSLIGLWKLKIKIAS